jgi:predicted transcriptional regulator
MNSTIGRNVRRLHKYSGYSQAEFAQRAGASQAWICRIEIGDENPTLTSMRRIVRALGVGIAELLQERPEEVV